MRIIEREDDFIESDRVPSGALTIVPRPRSPDLYFRDEGYELTRDTEITDSRGDREEIIERTTDHRGRISLVRRKE